MTDFNRIFKNNTDIQEVTVKRTSESISGIWYDFTHDVCQQTSIPEEGMILFARNDDLLPVNKNGKILKRLRKYLKDNYSYQLSDSIMGALGDLLQSYMVKNDDTFYVDFTDYFSDMEGYFGNEDSCYWGMYSDSIPALESINAWCVRFYKSLDSNYSNGIGRTWIVIMDDYIACFNSYGVTRQMTSKVLKEIFLKHGIELHYKRAEIYNSYNDNIPYINKKDHHITGGGFILGENVEWFNSGDSVDLEIEWCNYECHNCDYSVNDDSELTRVDNNLYCSDCYNDLFLYCPLCETDVSRDNTVIVYGDSMCESCARYNYHECYYCDNYFSLDDMIETSDGTLYCDTCSENHVHYCEVCEKYHDDYCEDEFIASEEETTSNMHDITMKTNQRFEVTSSRVIYTSIFRLKEESHLIVYRNDDDYTISHTVSKLAVCSGIKSLENALKGMKSLSSLDCFHMSADELYKNDDVMNSIREVVRGIERS